MDKKKLIFIACGQREHHEKKIGKDIYNLIETHNELKPFLAENTHSFNGLTSEIFENLNKCSGFIAVLHRREKYPEDYKLYNSSIWINQEIAIAAFLALRDKRDIPMRIFVESNDQQNIKIKGVLEYLMANPISFSNDDEVIRELTQWLSQTKFSIREKTEEYLLKGKRKITLLSGYTGDLHTYRLDLEIANFGKKTVTDISFEFYFPKGLSPDQFNSRLFDRLEPEQNEFKDFYIFSFKNNIPKILPGKSLNIYCFDFIVNHNIYFDGHTHKYIKWKIFADNMSPIEDEAPLEGLKGEGINF